MVKGREQTRRAEEKKALRQQILEHEQSAIWHLYRRLWLRPVAAAFAVLVILTALICLTGWITQSLELTSFDMALVPMSPASALSTLMLGLAAAVVALGARGRVTIVYGAAALISGLLLLRMGELIFGANLRASWLFSQAPETAYALPMSLPSLLYLVLAIVAVILAVNEEQDRALFPVATALMLFGGTFALGYAYGKPLMYQPHVIPMPLPTALAAYFLGNAILAIALGREWAVAKLIDGHVARYQQTLEELTRQLQRERWVLQTMIDSVPVGLALHDGRDLKVKWHNAGYTELMEPQWAGKDLVGKLAREYITDIGTLEDAYEDTAQGERRSVSEYAVNSGEAGLRYFDWVTVPVPTEHEDYFDILELGYEVSDQVKARQRIEELARSLEAVIDYAPNGIVFFSPKGEIMRINPAARRMLGYTQEMLDLVGAEPYSHLEIVDEAGEAVRLEDTASYRALRGEAVLGMVVNVQVRGADSHWLSVSAVPMYRDEDTLTGALAVLTDITELHEAQWEAQRLSDELQTILDHAPNGIVFYDTVGNILRINEAARGILGYTDEVIKLSPMERFMRHEVTDEEGRPIRPGEGVMEAALTGHTIHNQIARFNNTPRGSVWLSVSAGPTRDREGALSGVVAVFADVTALQQAQEELQRTATHSEQQRQELETILSSIADGVMVWSAEGGVERANDMARKIMPGYEQVGKGQEMIEDIKAREVAMADENLRPLEYDEVPLARAMKGEVLQNVVLYVTWPDGTSRWLSVSAAPISDEEGKVARVVTVFRDVTHVREHQEELERLVERRTAALVQNQKRLRAAAADLANAEQKERQRLASAIHDEVAQTLGAIKMYLGLLRRDCPNAVERISEITGMVDEANQQSREVMAELSPPVLQRIGLSEALKWWAGEVKRRYGLEVRVEGVTEVGRLETYIETTVFQAAKELIQNTIKHAQATQVELRLQCAEGQLELLVTDDGKGFDPATTESKPEGFGLFSVQERISYVGGEFELQSAPGEGTQVRLRLPVE